MNAAVNCEGCAHFKRLSAGIDNNACHYMLDTGKRREMDGDTCLSREESFKKPMHRFDIPLSQR